MVLWSKKQRWVGFVADFAFIVEECIGLRVACEMLSVMQQHGDRSGARFRLVEWI